MSRLYEVTIEGYNEAGEYDPTTYWVTDKDGRDRWGANWPKYKAGAFPQVTVERARCIG